MKRFLGYLFALIVGVGVLTMITSCNSNPNQGSQNTHEECPINKGCEKKWKKELLEIDIIKIIGF